MAHILTSEILDLPQIRRVSTTLGKDTMWVLFEGKWVKLQSISMQLVWRGESKMEARKRMLLRRILFWHRRGCVYRYRQSFTQDCKVS